MQNAYLKAGRLSNPAKRRERHLRLEKVAEKVSANRNKVAIDHATFFDEQPAPCCCGILML